MAKMLANRMKPLMEDVISESQSAFIPDRLITDNILLAAEVGHFLNRKQCGVGGWSALKLDMAKAYDCVEWSFLRKMMLALGFHGGWVELIMKCVTSVSYNIQANVEEANEIKRCLSVYEDLSGQAVNYHKSSICYSRNTSSVDRNNVAQILGVTQAPNFGKQRIGSWNKKLLSQAGKEILLKTVAQSMPTFSMSVFLLPISVCTTVERTMNRYWWDSGTDRRIHWKAWDKLCVPKKYGGLGFKDLCAFNLAMLGKQAWRMLTKPESLVARVYKARYFPKGTFFDAQMGNNPSFYWRSIMAAKSIVCGGVRRRIGNRETTLIWTYPWLQDENDPMIQTEMPVQLQEARVAGLIDQQTGTWDPSILTDLFQPDDVANIMRIPISPDYDDAWYWHGDPRDSDGMLYATAILYNIWRARNLAVWEATLPRPETVLKAAAAAKLAWTRAHPLPMTRAAQLLPEPALLQEDAELHGSEAYAAEPSHGLPMRICRVDGGFMQETSRAAVGAVLLDTDGGYVSAYTAPLRNCSSPLMAEALACKEALSWLKDRGEQNVEIYTDCLTLHHYLTTPTVGLRTYLGYAIDSCRRIASLFQSCSFCFSPRLDNYLAHALATTAYQQSVPMYWDLLPPDIISAYF
ncbi:PREDICTED: uncharacterized protein LOC109166643 [Ipomoea nil]|uniref:uncharacterized protein LOC109166643 n=1 Tax=Ipomoea nil TaxID=35883 RepID=UPI00090099FD|nr:PREDICTED: uncharacterized protein LOC109166643 [Ipomoea nil]